MGLERGRKACPRTAVILAALELDGSASTTPTLLGRSVVEHLMVAADEAWEAAGSAMPHQRVVVVADDHAREVREHLAATWPAATVVPLAGRRTAGRAVEAALAGVDGTGGVLVVDGAAALLRASTLRGLLDEYGRAESTVVALTAGESHGGRADGLVLACVLDPAGPRAFLPGGARNGATLADVVRALAAAGATVATCPVPDPGEARCVRDLVDLAAARAALRDRINDRWMRAGVVIVDPATTWIDGTVSVAPDAIVEPNTHLRGSTVVARGATVGPDTTLVDTTVEAGATVLRTHAVGAEIGADAVVGPYAYLRPGTRLARRAKVGTFVETKAVDIGAGAKVPHLSYVGDASIGEGTNIGAATVFVNYDGVHKHRTTIGAHARTGADNMFVAPVSVGDGAYTAAGSVITGDVPPGALGVARASQRNLDGWVEMWRAGTPAAEAARRARAGGADDSGTP